MAGKKKEDNRDIFDKALDGVEFALPAAGVVAGAVAGRKLSRAAHQGRVNAAKNDADYFRDAPESSFRYGKQQKLDEYNDAFHRSQEPYRKSGAKRGAVLGGIAGYGSSDVMDHERKRRK
jgi:hypothetical protein